MSLTRGMLKGMGLTEEQVSAIIDAHAETVDGLKESLKAAKADAEKLKTVQKELDDLKANNGDDYKAKYEKEHSDFDEYKKTVANEKATAEKRSLYRELLKDCGIDAKRIDTVMRVADIDAAKVKDGKIENAEDLTKSIKSEWADFIATDSTRGANVQTPPQGKGSTKMTREEIFRKDEHGKYVHSTQERINAIQANLEAQTKGE